MKRLKITIKEVAIIERVVTQEVFVNDDEALELQPFLSTDNGDEFNKVQTIRDLYFKEELQEVSSSFLISSTIIESIIEEL